MGFFSRIMDKIRGHAPGGASGQVTSGTSSTAPGQQAQYAPPAGQAGATPQVMKDVDVHAVLTALAAKKGGGGNWQTSIVDLLKMLDLDSSLEARKELATELHVNAGAPGTAEQNIALQKAVMRKLAENGGQVPASLRD